MTLTKQSPKSPLVKSSQDSDQTDLANRDKSNLNHSQDQDKRSSNNTINNDAKHSIRLQPVDGDQQQLQRQRQELRKLERVPELANGKDEKSPEVQQESSKQDQQQPQQAQHELSIVRKLAVDALMYLIRGIITLYDLISQPVYYYKHEVYRKQHEVDQVQRSAQLDPRDPNSPWRQINLEPFHAELASEIDSCETYDQMMLDVFRKFGDKPCYGYRTVLHEQWTKRPELEKLFRQVKLSEYNWVTFAQFNRQVEAARRGFLLQGVRAGDKVMLYADTRPEWQISSQALIRLGAVVVTMYSTLGVDGIVHSVNETEVTHVVAQKDKVGKLLRLKPKLPLLKKIIYLDLVLQLPAELGGPLSDQEVANREWQCDFEHPEVECISFGQLIALGRSADTIELVKLEEQSRKCGGKRHKDSIAVIMYTSGSTGIPKGVLISHRNIMATIKSFSYSTKDFVRQADKNICTAYLPLAHIFEFCIESVMLYHGVRYGFATPHTLTDKSPGLIAGQVGDLTILKPTVMIIVPLILDRIVQGVRQALRAQSYFKEQLVTYLIGYKAYWQARHYRTPLVDKIVCNKISMALGGRAKYVICGSAPLSGETQVFVRSALNLRLPQGFGTTETCAATAVQLFDDQSTNNVGLPVSDCFIKLEPWIEGNYRPTDEPNPRGEIVVGGEMIAHGYFKLDDQTSESFYVDEEGMRWYRTGDIGEFLPNGNLKIIDRKKDLVKLQNGEYISLGKVESTLKSNPYLDNFCVYANSKYNYVVALGPANEASIKALAQQLLDEHSRKSPSLKARDEERKSLLMSASHRQAALDELKEVLALYEADSLNNNHEESFTNRKMSSLSTNSTSLNACIDERLNRLCENKLVQEHVLSHLSELARERNLMGLEVPKKLMLLAEEWTEDKNLVTAAMKIRRNYIYKRYEQDLSRLYSSKPGA